MKTKLIVLVSLLVVSSVIAVWVGWGDLVKPRSQTSNNIGNSNFSLQPQEARAQSYAVKAEHPRVLLTPELLTTLQGRMQNNTKEWQNLKSYCDTNIGKNPGGLAYWVEGVAPYSIAYNVLKDSNPQLADKYAQEALKYMKAIARDWNVIGGGLTGMSPIYNGEIIARDHGYDIRVRGVYLALSYDWLYNYPGFTPELKQEFYNTLNRWLDWFVNGDSVNPGGGWTHNGPGDSNYFLGYFAAKGLTAYATYGDNPRAQEHIDGARNLLNTLVFPGLNEQHKGGDYGDWNYGPLALINAFYYVDAVRTATGEDLRDQFQFAKDVVFFKTQALKPNRKNVYEGGTWSGNTVGNPSYNDMTYLSYIYKDNDYQISKYLQYYINEVKPYTSKAPEIWQAFVWNDNSITPEDCRPTQPLSYFAPGMGQVLMRSDWSNSGVWASFRVGYGSASMSTFGFDQGHFQIYKNDDLAIDAGLWEKDGVVKPFSGATSYHNTILIDDKGEKRLVYPPGQGVVAGWIDVDKLKITAFEDKGDYVYAMGQFGEAYGAKDGPDALKYISRQFIYLRPATFIVYDRISNKLKDYYTSIWRVNFAKEPEISDDTVIGTYNGGRLFNKVLLPINRTITKGPIKPDLVPKTTYYVDVKTDVPSYNDIFLNVLYAADATVSSMILSQTIESISNNMSGAQLDVSANDTRVVMFSKTETTGGLNETIIYNVSGTGALKHLIVDLKPNTQFTIINTNTDTGVVVQTQTLNSSDKGTLYFTTTLGSNHQITIQPQGAAPIPACSVAGGTCQANACNTYSSCVSLIGTCSTGNCCSGACTVIPAPTPTTTPNIVLTKSANKTQASSGEEITYTIVYNNTGAGNAKDVIISDNIPTGTTYVTGSATNGGTLSTSSGQATLSWNVGAVPAGGSGSVSFRAEVN